MTSQACIVCILLVQGAPAVLLPAAAAPGRPAAGPTNAPKTATLMAAAAPRGPIKIIVRVGRQDFAATLLDTPPARDFASLLPLTVTLKDYAATEKISDLPRALLLAGAPAGVDPAPGDIAYYSPWGNLAIFYGDAPYAPGLVKLGRFDSAPSWPRVAAGPFKAVIQVVGR